MWLLLLCWTMCGAPIAQLVGAGVGGGGGMAELVWGCLGGRRKGMSECLRGKPFRWLAVLSAAAASRRL